MDRHFKWQQALKQASELYHAAYALSTDQADTLSHLTSALRGKEQRVALLLLHSLDPWFTVALTDQLVECALSHRNALLVRQIFGRLHYVQAQELVPAAVWRSLDALEPDDYDAYRRYAELLYHLGLWRALNQLCDRALASPSPDIREVGEEFAIQEDDREGLGEMRPGKESS